LSRAGRLELIEQGAVMGTVCAESGRRDKGLGRVIVVLVARHDHDGRALVAGAAIDAALVAETDFMLGLRVAADGAEGG
jgi:hypothetical protein